MELSFRQLKKREVINLTDGRSLGHIVDLIIDFPKGNLSGITVPNRKCHGIFRIFDKTELFINVNRILKIGNDVIIVDLKEEESCANSVSMGPKPPKKPPSCPPNPCNPCKPPCPPHGNFKPCDELPNAEQLFGENCGNVGFDSSDY